MPIGYIVGKQYRVNTEYDRWAKLEVFRLILRAATQRGYGVFTTYSYIGRNYSAEIKTYRRYKEGGDPLLCSIALKSADTPLAAMCDALKEVLAKHPEHDDLYMRVLFMEAEAAELAITLERVREREKKEAAVEKKLSDALDTLFEVLALAQGYRTRAEMQLLIANPAITIQSKFLPGVGTMPIDPDEDDDL